MRQTYNNSGEEVSIIKVFVKNKTKESEEEKAGYSIDIECYDVFLTDFIKSEVEKLCAITLRVAPEIQIYRHIKDKMPIVEFKATQFLAGNYKISIYNPFEQYLEEVRKYNRIVSVLSKSMIERITYLFNAFSLDNY